MAASSLSYKVFEKAANSALSKVKFGYVVVQFGFWFNLDFSLFFSMLIYDNEYQTKGNPN